MLACLRGHPPLPDLLQCLEHSSLLLHRVATGGEERQLPQHLGVVALPDRLHLSRHWIVPILSSWMLRIDEQSKLHMRPQVRAIEQEQLVAVRDTVARDALSEHLDLKETRSGAGSESHL